MTSRRWLGSLLVAAVAIVVAVAAVGLHSGGSDPPAVTIAVTAPPGTPVLRVGGPRSGRALQSGFIGLSIEFSALPAYAGRGGDAVDPVFEQLIRNLAPGQRPVLRIGGDSTDRTWVAVRGMQRPRGVKYTVGRSWLQTAGALARALSARVIAGIDFEANSSRLASTEARALLAAIGRSSLLALELGNEPELYGTFPWYQADGHGVIGRPAGWDVPAYIKDFSRIARSLPRVPLAAPATGAAGWMLRLGQIATAEPAVGVATVHRYPLQRCFTSTTSPQYPTISHLLSTASSAGLADSVAGFVAVAHAHGLPARVDEFNSVSCSGKRGVSDTFASALWALDASFQMARVGVDGVNIHTFPGGVYQPFRLRHVHGGWLGSVAPAYYGLMMFARAAPAGSRLLTLSGSPGARVRAWATRTPDRAIRVVLINDYLRRPRYVALRIPGVSGPAALERLRAPSVGAKAGVTLDGRSFGAQTKTGLLTGPGAKLRGRAGQRGVRGPPTGGQRGDVDARAVALTPDQLPQRADSVPERARGPLRRPPVARRAHSTRAHLQAPRDMRAPPPPSTSSPRACLTFVASPSSLPVTTSYGCAPRRAADPRGPSSRELKAPSESLRRPQICVHLEAVDSSAGRRSAVTATSGVIVSSDARGSFNS